MLEYVALDTMYFIVIEPILMFFYKSHQKSDGILRGSLVKYVTISDAMQRPHIDPECLRPPAKSLRSA
jgi:hypothetical protein